MNDSSMPGLSPMPLVPSAPPQVQQAMRVADAFMATAEQLVVDSPMMFDQAAGELVRIRERYKAVEAQRVHLKEPFLEGCRRIDAFFKEPLDRLTKAGEAVKGTMLVFQRAEDARAAEARRVENERQQAERAALAKAQADADAAARVARDEAARVEREAAAVASQELDEEKRALADAELARARQAAADAEQQAIADAEAAQQAMDLADVAPPAPVVVSGAKAAGVATRKTWKLLSADKRALVLGAAAKAAAGDDSWLEFLEVNESALGKLAGALKGATRVDGCVFGEVSSLAATGRGR